MMTISSREVGEILGYPIKDPQWFSKLCLQVMVMLLLSFFLIGLPFLMGYMIRCIQKGISQDPTLPDWSEWGLFWKLGWKTFLVGFIFWLPIFLVVILMICGVVTIVFLTEAKFVSESITVFPFILLALLAYGVILVYSLVLALLQPAYLTIIALGQSVWQCFNLQQLWHYTKSNVLTILVGIAIFYLAAMISTLGMAIMFIGYFFTYGYALAAGGYTYGLIYRQSAVKLQ